MLVMKNNNHHNNYNTNHEEKQEINGFDPESVMEELDKNTVVSVTPTKGAGNNADVRKMNIPKGIRVPDYLRNYLEEIDVPSTIDNDFLLKLGDGALKAKIQDVEEFNMMIKTAKKRIPTRLDFEDVAVILLSLFTFVNIQKTERKEDTILAVYDEKEGTYSTNKKRMYEIIDRIAEGYKNRDKQDVLDKIELSVPTVEPTKERHLYAVGNGIYNRKTKTLEPFDPKYVFETKIPVQYKPNPVNPVITAPDGYKWDVESWLADIASNDDEVIELLWQVIADCLQPNHSRHKSIWFYSEKGNNGKGTVGQLIKNLLGKGNYSSLSVDDFKHEFLKETLLGVAANISDENDVDIYIDSVKDYKASVTGDDININRKFEKPIRIQFFGTNIQMMNGLPKTKDKSDSFYRRIILVPFLKSFTNNGERKYIKDDYIGRQEVLEYVLHKAINMDFDEYIVPKVSSELLAEYKESNNPVLEFWNDVKDEFVWDLLPTTFLFDLFTKWEERNNPSRKGMLRSSTFLKQIRAVINADGGWEDRTERNQKVRSQGKMDDFEPLIIEYGLDRPDKDGKPSQWVKPNYAGDDMAKRCEFVRKATYRGFVRI